MKKIFQVSVLCFLVAAVFCLQGCGGNKEKLYLLNWDEYIDEELIDAFEAEYNCKVVLDKVESNEIMYSQIKRGNTYDICFPSDYMIAQLQAENLVHSIDFSKIENYSYDKFDSTLTELIDRDCASIKDYFVPYFWGSLGIMYNTKNLSPDKIDQIKEEGWNVLFDPTFSNKIAMYNSSRDSIASALLAKGYSLNTTNLDELKEAEDLLASMKGKYKGWATDDLKVGVASGKYDVALVYSGDFFDVLYSSLEDNEKIEYDCYAPKDANNIFFDGMVIPSTCQNEELAYQFINFMIAEGNALQNAQFVGYCPTLTSVFETMAKDPELAGITDLDVYYPGDIINGEIYKYLGAEIYSKYEEIFKRVK